MRTKRLHKQVVSIYIYSKNIYSNIYIKRKRKKKKESYFLQYKKPKASQKISFSKAPVKTQKTPN